MKNNRCYANWLAVGLVASLLGVSACEDHQDFSYKGNLDLNQLVIKQAREIWTGSDCNVTTALEIGDEEADNFSYSLNLALYQDRTATQDATVDLVVDADTLATLVAAAEEGDTYENAALLPEDCYLLPSTQLTLQAGSTLSSASTLTVYSQDLIELVQAAGHDSCFVLPLKIANSTSYAINPVVNTVMFIFNVTYVEQEIDPDYVPVEEEATIGDAYGDTEYLLVWHDEFNGTGIPDADEWRFEEGFQRNEELQWYYDQNAVCADGTLVITGKVEQIENPNYDPTATGNNSWKKTRQYAEYTSSSIISSYRFRKGIMEVRAKIPTAQGAWPAIWTTGASDIGAWEWPLGGEIDVLEFYLVSGVQSLHANACWGTNTRWSAKWDSYHCPLTDFTSEDKNWTEKYHLWRMDWDDEYIRLYLDDKLMNEIDLSQTTNGSGGLSWWHGAWRNPFTDEGDSNDNFGQQIYLNLALGGNGGTPDVTQFPLEYRVDYVRVHQNAE